MKIIDHTILILIIIILISGILEISILGIAFFGADKVECNLLWCTFTSQKTFRNDSIIIETHNTCFLNGYEIDCNDNRTDLQKVITSGNFDNMPIFKHNKEWKDIFTEVSY